MNLQAKLQRTTTASCKNAMGHEYIAAYNTNTKHKTAPHKSAMFHDYIVPITIYIKLNTI